MIFKDHFDYRGKATELRAERAVIRMEGFVRQLYVFRVKLIVLRNAFRRL